MAAVEQLGLEVFIIGFATFKRQMTGMNNAIGKTEGKWLKMGGVAGKVGRILSGAVKLGLIAVGAAAIGAAVAMGKLVQASITASIDFESAFAGVIKTVDGLTDAEGNLTEQGEELRQGFRDLAKEIPITVDELAGIGEMGGQLGIASEDLLDFTRIVAELGVTTNLSFEGAATGIAKFGNIMGSSQEDLERFASTIVALGNNTATTEADILNFAKRIAGAGNIAGFAEADIAGIAAAFSSAGIEAEAGGTAVQKVMLNITAAVNKGAGTIDEEWNGVLRTILTATDTTFDDIATAFQGGNSEIEAFANKAGVSVENLTNAFVLGSGTINAELSEIAAVAGLTAEQFGAMWEDDAAGAFEAFVEGLGTAGDDAIQLLDDLDLKDQRLIRSFLSLAGAGDLLETSLITANKAFEDNNALSDEADKRFATTESKVQVLKNTFNDLAIGIGDNLLPMFNDFIDALVGFLNDNGPAITAWFEMAAAWLGENIPIALEALRTFWEETWPAILAKVEEVWAVLQPIFEAIGEWFTNEGPSALADIQAAWADVWGFIQEVASDFVEWFQENLPMILEVGQMIADFWNNSIVPALSAAWEAIKSIVLLALQLIRSNASNFMKLLTGDWEGLWAGIKETVSLEWELIKTILIGALNVILGFFGTSTKDIGDKWSDLWDSFVDTWTTFWDGFISQWSKNWELLKEIVSKSWEGIKTKWTDFWSDFSATWAENWEMAKTIIATVWQNIIDGAVAAWENFNATVAAKLEEFLNIFGFTTEGVSNFWDEVWADIQAIAEALIPFLIQWVIDKIGEITTFFTEFVEGIKETWTLFWEALNTKLIEIFTLIKDFISTTLEEILGVFGTSTGEVSTKWTEFWDGVFATASTMIASVRDTLIAIWGEISTFVQTTFDTMKSAWDTFWTDFSTTWSANWTLAQEILGTIAQTILDKIEGLWLSITETWKTFWADFKEQWQKNWNLLVTITSSVILKIINAIKGKVGEFITVGKNIIDGIKSGIISAAKNLALAAAQAARDALAAAKAALGIESPSKEFAKVGEQSVAGWIGGIRAGAPALVNEVAQTAQALPAVASANSTTTSVVNNNSSTNNFNLTTNSSVRSGGLAMEFSSMALGTR